MRAAASSIASGNPSRRWQIRATTRQSPRSARSLGARRGRPLGEQADRVRAKRVAASAPAASGRATATRAGLAGESQRLAAGGEDANARTSREDARDEAGASARTCSQLSTTRSARRRAGARGHGRRRPAATAARTRRRVGDDAADVGGVTRAGELDEPGAVGEWGSTSAPARARDGSCRTPGGPTSVTRRRSPRVAAPRRARTARPTNDVRGAGRLPRRRRAGGTWPIAASCARIAACSWRSSGPGSSPSFSESTRRAS